MLEEIHFAKKQRLFDYFRRVTWFDDLWLTFGRAFHSCFLVDCFLAAFLANFHEVDFFFTDFFFADLLAVAAGA